MRGCWFRVGLRPPCWARWRLATRTWRCRGNARSVFLPAQISSRACGATCRAVPGRCTVRLWSRVKHGPSTVLAVTHRRPFWKAPGVNDTGQCSLLNGAVRMASCGAPGSPDGMCPRLIGGACVSAWGWRSLLSGAAAQPVVTWALSGFPLSQSRTFLRVRGSTELMRSLISRFQGSHG